MKMNNKIGLHFTNYFFFFVSNFNIITYNNRCLSNFKLKVEKIVFNNTVCDNKKIFEIIQGKTRFNLF